ASGTAVLTNSDVTFYIGVTNYGPNTSSNVVVLDNLPTAFKFVSATPSLGSVTNDGQTVTWNVANSLADTVGAQLTLTLQAPNALEQAENSAIVTPGTPDPNPADSSAYVIVNVLAPTPPILSSGGTGTGGVFHLTVSNSQLPVIIQASTNLVNWVNVATNSAPFTFTDTNAPGFHARFYRAVVQ
ncbi:MAG TPA: DUF11 domain-containing protein, partial [Verrucomicrobiae bacterium]|nr:DUF11 domain-containing protein [Verrucomicrobiae bacterium]